MWIIVSFLFSMISFTHILKLTIDLVAALAISLLFLWTLKGGIILTSSINILVVNSWILFKVSKLLKKCYCHHGVEWPMVHQFQELILVGFQESKLFAAESILPTLWPTRIIGSLDLAICHVWSLINWQLLMGMGEDTTGMCHVITYWRERYGSRCDLSGGML